MTKVLVLGGTGMLGSMVASVLSDYRALEVTATFRSGAKADASNVKWKAFSTIDWDCFDSDGKLNYDDDVVAVEGADWIINCIGVTKPFIKNEKDLKALDNAILTNTIFPFALQKTMKPNTRLIQIATDCVFSGLRGPYTELSKHDAIDVYGKTKSLGEVPASNVVLLRTSIIGPEVGRDRFLLEWFLGQKKDAVVSGYTNHLWNGITTYQFARICAGIIMNNSEVDGVHHVIPSYEVTKCELLKLFGKHFGRGDIIVNPSEAKEVVDRRLRTEDREFNEKLWSLAGYKKVPTVEEMVEELAKERSRK